MALTRAQLLSGNSNQGPVLEGQVQGVRQGSGVHISPEGVISFSAETAEGVLLTNNPGAFNQYVWPGFAPPDNSLLSSGTSSALNWVSRGFGISETGTLKSLVEISEEDPTIGSEPREASNGNLYWNSESEKLFLCSGGNWIPVSYDPPDLQRDLLTGSYTLFVNPETGSDAFFEGDYESGVGPGGITVTNQMVNCGYTPQKPFKTIQRAALEAARIQSSLGGNSQLYDRFVIRCSAGEHIIYNEAGTGGVSAWVDEFDPNSTDLVKLNSESKSGVILPRGISVIGEDLRKTIIRPSFVPDRSGDIEEDRGSIFRITGGGFFFNFSFKDKTGLEQSHHLLDCFSFVSSDDLEDYYEKVSVIFSQPFENEIVNPGETEIVAPQPPGEGIEETDGVFGSSPYIFNCSVRSLYGLCGLNADGSQVTGFKSVVTAQFTGVSLQKDLTCWQKYNSGPKTWTNTITNYSDYIFRDPDNVRMDPEKRSYHIRAINNAFIQEVSVFAIGQGIHHWVHSGGEVSITNSNSSFGGCAALAQGYKTEVFPQDTNWNVASLNLATNLAEQTPNVRNIYLGTVSALTTDSSTTIYLDSPLEESDIYPGIPQILSELGYTLKENSYLWVENPEGLDWRSLLDADAWVSSDPDEIRVQNPMENQNEDEPGGARPGGTWPSLVGSRVYVRRLTDTRTLDKRRYSINCTNTDSNTRTPLRDYVLQTTQGIGAGVIGSLPDEDMTIVNKSGPIPIGSDPVVRKVQVVLERSNPSNTWTSSSENFYRPGDTVKYQNKHFTCLVTNSDSTFDPDKWSESYVHMQSSFNAYDYLGNVAPLIIFDNDTDDSTPTTNCGYDLTSCWTTDPEVKRQYTTATDYRGVYQFLIGIGFSDEEVTDLLVPAPISERSRNPSSTIDMLGYEPDGAANELSNWAVEFRRPSVIRMFSHAWEWAGFLNYSKALPAYQKDLSPQNQFTYYFTNELGGKVYATGYNQEGFLVTPAGLTDLGTGATISVSGIGSPISGVDVPTYYPNLSVDNLIVNQSAIFNGTFLVNGSITADNVYTPGLGLTVEEKNLKLSVPISSSPPSLGTGTNLATEGSLYWDTDIEDMFILYDDGGGPSWTNAVPSSIPSGSKLTFHNSTAPVGWTQDVSFNNGTIRIVSGAGGGVGGTSNFSDVFTSWTPTISSHILDLNQIPSHTHSYIKVDGTTGAGGEAGFAYETTVSDNTGASGGGLGHSHGSSTLNFSVKYIDMILCTKD